VKIKLRKITGRTSLMIFNDDYFYAFIVEGATEKSIIEILLENNRFTFSSDSVINYDLINGLDSPYKGPGKFYGCPDNFTNEYLNQEYEEKKIIIFLVEDRDPAYKIDSIYHEKIQNIYHVITRPEIEFIEILYDDDRSDFEKACRKHKTLKPSEFLSQTRGMKMAEVKRGKRTKVKFQENIDKLIQVIKSLNSKGSSIQKSTRQPRILLRDLLP